MSPNTHATRATARVALVTSTLFPDLYDDDFPLRDALRARGATVDALRWDDPAADWDAYGVAVLRSPWDYVARRDEFVAWAHRVPRLLNPADVVEWNTDKVYLRSLLQQGLPVTPTTFVAPGDAWAPPADGDWVIKPAISAGSQDTGRYRFPGQAGLAAAHVERLTAAGRTAMVQPFLAAVDSAGETALMFFAGPDGGLVFSHAARKGPMLSGPDEGTIDITDETITPREASPAEREVAERVVAAVPDAGRLLYARVDLIPGPDGSPLLVELELTEPSLFLRTDEAAAGRLADAILHRL